MSVGLLGGWRDRQDRIGRVSIYEVLPIHPRTLLEPLLAACCCCCNVVTHVDDGAHLAGQVTARIDNKAEKNRQFKTWDLCCCKKEICDLLDN